MMIETYVFVLMFLAICFGAILSILGWMRESERLEQSKKYNEYLHQVNDALIKENWQLRAERNLKVATEYNEEGKKK